MEAHFLKDNMQLRNFLWFILAVSSDCFICWTCSEYSSSGLYTWQTCANADYFLIVEIRYSRLKTAFICDFLFDRLKKEIHDQTAGRKKKEKTKKQYAFDLLNLYCIKVEA